MYADLQATTGSEPCYHDPTVRLQDWRVSKFFTVLNEIYGEYKCDGLIDLGDTTDDRSAIPIPTINSLLSGLSLFEGWNVKLIGNHEQYTRDGSINIGKLFQKVFTVVDRVTAMDSPDSDAVFVFASYPGSYPELIQELENMLHAYRGKKLILFGHFQVIGSALNSGLAYDGVPKELVSRFDMAFLGHVHKPQAITPNVHYVGSPFQQNFGESGEDKRVGIFDTELFHVEWIPMTELGFPIYRSVSAKEFVEQVSEESEDRYHVVLSSQADTELLYGHPLCGRAETEYSYTNAQASSATALQSWSFEDVLKRYMLRVPPKDAGIDLPADEMLTVGTDIAHGNT
jgi:hypothetical protein